MTEEPRNRGRRLLAVVAFAVTASVVAAAAPAGAAPAQAEAPVEVPQPPEPAQVQDTTNRRPDPSVVRSLTARAQAQGRVGVIVGLRATHTPEGALSPADAAAQRTRLASTQDAFASELRGTGHQVVRRFRTIPFVAVEMAPDAIARAANSPRVASLEEDTADEPDLSRTTEIVQSTQMVRAGLTGAGATVAVLDTGVEAGHTFLNGSVVDQACFTDGDCPNGTGQQVGPNSAVPCTYSTKCDHGTHVAGIVSGDGSYWDGVAPKAPIFAIQVFSRRTDCGSSPSPCPKSRVSDQIAALEYVFERRSVRPVAAVNMSLGGGSYSSICDDAQSSRKAAVDTLRSAGIATVASSGNSSLTGALGAPACISSVISVGNTTKDDTVWSSSNSASFLDLLAPGREVLSSIPGGSYAKKTGTSMAAPHVAGAWAQLKSAQPDSTVDQILTVLKKTGKSITDSRNGITKPRIQLMRAIEALGTVRFSDVSVSEGGVAKFKVWLVKPEGQQVKVSVSTQGVSAKAGEDYTAKWTTLTFAAYERTKYVEVQTLSDDVYEWRERFNLVALSASGVNLGPDRYGVGTINDSRYAYSYQPYAAKG